MIPGEILPPDDGPDTLTLNAGRARLEIDVENTGDRPVQVGSHFHFAEANEALAFDRAAARGFRLDVAPGTAIRFEPGIGQRVTLVALAGNRVVPGLRGLVAGPIDDHNETD
jgi:urease beta subunit